VLSFVTGMMGVPLVEVQRQRGSGPAAENCVVCEISKLPEAMTGPDRFGIPLLVNAHRETGTGVAAWIWFVSS
jgi:hypothetical protein